jgi:glyoxylase-like metal-dependent hydrolase (beta-lactamase superfamily II)
MRYIKTSNYVIHPIPLCVVEDFPRASLHWLLPVPLEEKVRDGHFVWYLEGPRENYLVNAGATAERFTSRNFKATHIQTLDEGLQKLGLEVGDIDYVIVTHSHYDHTSNLRRFPRAKAIIQEAELEQIRHPFPYTQPRLPKDFQELFKGVRWEVIKGDARIDDQIELLFTPGHSAGGQSVAVKTAEGIAVITGWCCHRENFDPPNEFRKKGYPFTIGASHTNPVELYESTRRVIELADLIIPCHEVGAPFRPRRQDRPPDPTAK